MALVVLGASVLALLVRRPAQRLMRRRGSASRTSRCAQSVPELAANAVLGTLAEALVTAVIGYFVLVATLAGRAQRGFERHAA